jgi:hypothetical protein
MRELVPLRRLVKDVAETVQIDRSELSKVSAVWEDTNAAIVLA